MPHRYTVVTDNYAQFLMDELSVADPAIGRDIQLIFNDLFDAPHSARVQKSRGYYIRRRGAVEIKYQVSDDDRLVKIIGIRRCAHPFDVVLSLPVRDWLNSTIATGEADLAIDAVGHWIPRLRRDSRLVGHRLAGNLYQDSLGRVSIQFEINEPNCRVVIVSIMVS